VLNNIVGQHDISYREFKQLLMTVLLGR